MRGVAIATTVAVALLLVGATGAAVADPGEGSNTNNSTNGTAAVAAEASTGPRTAWVAPGPGDGPGPDRATAAGPTADASGSGQVGTQTVSALQDVDRVAWTHRLPDESYDVGPVFDSNGNLYVTANGAEPNLTRLSPDGVQQWSFTPNVPAFAVRGPVVHSGTVYFVTTTFEEDPGEAHLYAVDASTGNKDWEVSLTNDHGPVNAWRGVRTDDQGNVYVVLGRSTTDFSQPTERYLVSYDASGNLRWNTTLWTGIREPRIVDVTSSEVILSGRDAVRIDRSTGSVNGRESDTPYGSLVATPRDRDGDGVFYEAVYGTSEIHAVDASNIGGSTNATVWTADLSGYTNGNAWGTPVEGPDGDFVYWLANPGIADSQSDELSTDLVVLYASNGSVAATRDLSITAPSKTTPEVGAGGDLYALTNDNEFVAFDRSGGRYEVGAPSNSGLYQAAFSDPVVGPNGRLYFGYTPDFGDRSVLVALNVELLWNESADWDAATDENGVVHADFGDNDASVVRIGYPASDQGQNEDALVGYWPMDENSGGTVADATGNNDGVWNDSSTSGRSYSLGRQGVFGTTGAFFHPDGGTDKGAWVDLDDGTSDLMDNTSITLSAWIRTDEGDKDAILGFNTPAAETGSQTDRNTLLFYVEGGQLDLYDGSFHDSGSDAFVADGSWHHVAATISNGGTVRLYVDGTQVDQYTTSVRVRSNDVLSIGQEYDANDFGFGPGSSDFFNGTIDEVRLYSRALSSGEIADLADPPGTLTTGEKSFPAPVDPADLTLGEVTADLPSSTGATLTVESRPPGASTFTETSDPISLGDGTNTYSVTGLSTRSATYRLQVELTTSDATATPCLAGAQLNAAGGRTGLFDATPCDRGAVPGETPTASFTVSPSSPSPGENVTFDASASSDPNGVVTRFEWEFGDGTTGEGEVAYNTYASSGDYTVTLTVYDDDGNTDTATRTVSVGTGSNGAGALSVEPGGSDPGDGNATRDRNATGGGNTTDGGNATTGSGSGCDSVICVAGSDGNGTGGDQPDPAPSPTGSGAPGGGSPTAVPTAGVGRPSAPGSVGTTST